MNKTIKNILLVVASIGIVTVVSYSIWFAIWSYSFSLSGWMGM